MPDYFLGGTTVVVLEIYIENNKYIKKNLKYKFGEVKIVWVRHARGWSMTSAHGYNNAGQLMIDNDWICLELISTNEETEMKRMRELGLECEQEEEDVYDENTPFIHA